MDETFFRVVNNLAGHSPVADAIGVFCAKPLIYIMGVGAAALAVYWWIKAGRRMPLMVGAVAIICNELLVQLAKLGFAHDRPFVALDDVNLLIAPPLTHAFPSGHTAAAFAIAVSIWLCNRRWGAGFLAVAVAIGLSRMFVGVHWPLDVLAGAIVGSMVAFAAYKLVQWRPVVKSQT